MASNSASPTSAISPAPLWIPQVVDGPARPQRPTPNPSAPHAPTSIIYSLAGGSSSSQARTTQQWPSSQQQATTTRSPASLQPANPRQATTKSKFQILRKRKLKGIRSTIQQRSPRVSRKRLGRFLINLIMLALTVIGLAFTYISLSLSSWTAQKDFRDNCFNQQQTFGWMTRACNETLSEQLQQPPHFSGFYRSKRSAFPDTISRRDDIPGRLNGAIGLELVMCVSPAVFIFFNNQGKENHRRGSALSIPPLFYSGMKRACGQISAFILVHSLPMTFGQCWWPFRLYYMLQILRFLRIFWVETELDIYRGTHLPAGNLLPVKIAAKRSVTYGNAEFETLLLVKLMEGCLVGSSRILFCYGFFAASIDSTIFVTGFLLVDFFFTCIEEEQEDATTSSSYLLRALPQTPLSIYQQHVKTVLVQT